MEIPVIDTRGNEEMYRRMFKIGLKDSACFIQYHYLKSDYLTNYVRCWHNNI